MVKVPARSFSGGFFIILNLTHMLEVIGKEYVNLLYPVYKDIDAYRVFIDHMVEAIEKLDSTEFLIGQGTSGLAVGLGISLETNIPYCHIRKEGEDSHGGDMIPSTIGGLNNYLLVDDFIVSGKTITRLYEKFSGMYPSKLCNGILVESCSQSVATRMYHAFGLKTYTINNYI